MQRLQVVHEETTGQAAGVSGGGASRSAVSADIQIATAAIEVDEHHAASPRRPAIRRGIPLASVPSAFRAGSAPELAAVSYTHLTLPTSDLV